MVSFFLSSLKKVAFPLKHLHMIPSTLEGSVCTAFARPVSGTLNLNAERCGYVDAESLAVCQVIDPVATWFSS